MTKLAILVAILGGGLLAGCTGSSGSPPSEEQAASDLSKVNQDPVVAPGGAPATPGTPQGN